MCAIRSVSFVRSHLAVEDANLNTTKYTFAYKSKRTECEVRTSKRQAKHSNECSPPISSIKRAKKHCRSPIERSRIDRSRCIGVYERPVYLHIYGWSLPILFISCCFFSLYSIDELYCVWIYLNSFLLAEQVQLLGLTHLIENILKSQAHAHWMHHYFVYSLTEIIESARHTQIQTHTHTHILASLRLIDIMKYQHNDRKYTHIVTRILASSLLALASFRSVYLPFSLLT